MKRLFRRLLQSNLLVSVATLLASFAGLAISIGVPFVLAPERYTVFATTWAIGQFVATLGFEWMRFGVLRFGQGADAREVAARRTILWLAYLTTGLVFLALAGIGVLAALAGIARAGELSLILVFAAMNGGFDGYQALMRAEGRNAEFSAGRILRTLLGFAFAMLAAILFESASAVLIGLAVSFPVSLLIVSARRMQWPGWVRRPENGRRVLRQVFLFGLFAAVTTNLAMILPALQRIALVRALGASEAAGVALSFDLSQKAISVVGLAVNVVVMQASIRVAEFETDSAVQARQAGRQFALTLAVVAPAAVGFYLVGKPLAELAVRPEMRMNFLETLLPATITAGVLAFRMFSIDPLFLIRQKTFLGTYGAAVTAVAMMFPLLMSGLGVTAIGWTFALAMVLGVSVSLAILVMLGNMRWPWKDLTSIAIACLAMVLATTILPPMNPAASLASTFALAGGTYAVITLVADIAGIRTILFTRGPR
jgi:O-antigen/teichoic acid export membrane protein